MKGISLTVSQLNEYVRKSLASDPMLRGLCIRGEISNFKRHVSGHWYFTLKDADAAISCAMFRQSAQGVRFRPENGQQVRVFGSVGLYAKTGSYQFYADAMEPDGLGDLFLRFEALKERLTREGLFDASLKKPLPLLPRGIGIITSQTGAVVHDIERVARRRCPSVPLYLCPVKVQGDGAAEEIARAIKLMDAFEGADVLIVGRGGGSMEDLWAFNEEVVARAIADCQTPVVSAVGHETDFTIADFVADLRAPTPSAAAELAVPSADALRASMQGMLQRMARAGENALSEKRLALAETQKRLMDATPERQSERTKAKVATLMARMETLVREGLTRRTHALEQASLRMQSASPMATVRRGYAIVTKNGKPVRSVEGMQQGDSVSFILADGHADAAITQVQKGEQPWRAEQ